MGVVPVGSGNDYAATLGMSGKVDRAVRQILEGEASPVDVGLVNGSYFVETLSFGLDAAIALDTVERRKKTGRSGTVLYLESGIDQLFHHLDALSYHAVLSGCPDAENVVDIAGESFFSPFNSGRPMAGTSRYALKLDVDDGLLDVCLAHPPLGVLRATGMFLMAKNGHHTRFKQIDFRRAKSIEVAFGCEPPVQMDGEKLTGSTFSISTVPGALKVVHAPGVLSRA